MKEMRDKILEKDETEREKVKCKLFQSQTTKIDTKTELNKQRKNLVTLTDRHVHSRKENFEDLKRKLCIKKSVQEQKGEGGIREHFEERIDRISEIEAENKNCGGTQPKEEEKLGK